MPSIVRRAAREGQVSPTARQVGPGRGLTGRRRRRCSHSSPRSSIGRDRGRSLAPGGYICLGHAESMSRISLYSKCAGSRTRSFTAGPWGAAWLIERCASSLWTTRQPRQALLSPDPGGGRLSSRRGAQRPRSARTAARQPGRRTDRRHQYAADGQNHLPRHAQAAGLAAVLNSGACRQHRVEPERRCGGARRRANFYHVKPVSREDLARYHRFGLVNAEGNPTFVKFHWRPTNGSASIIWDEAATINRADLDLHRLDFYEAIAKLVSTVAKPCRRSIQAMKRKDQ